VLTDDHNDEDDEKPTHHHPSAMASQVETLKQVLVGNNPWVLFENGTVVILANEAGKNRDENTFPNWLSRC